MDTDWVPHEGLIETLRLGVGGLRLNVATVTLQDLDVVPFEEVKLAEGFDNEIDTLLCVALVLQEDESTLEETEVDTLGVDGAGGGEG